MSPSYDYSRRLGAAAVLWLGFMPVGALAQQSTLVQAAPTPPRLAPPPAEAVMMSAPASAAASSSLGSQAECCNYGLQHRWQYHWKPRMIEKHSGTSQTLNVRPFGVSVRGPLDLQINSGIAAQLVLYQYDFQADTLNARGRRQALRISELARKAPGPIVIQPSGDEALDRARQLHVVAYLAEQVGFPNDPDAVVIHHPRARGLSGEESRLINMNVLQQLQSGGSTYLNEPAINNNGSVNGQSPISSGSGTGATSIR